MSHGSAPSPTSPTSPTSPRPASLQEQLPLHPLSPAGPSPVQSRFPPVPPGTMLDNSSGRTSREPGTRSLSLDKSLPLLPVSESTLPSLLYGGAATEPTTAVLKSGLSTTLSGSLSASDQLASSTSGLASSLSGDSASVSSPPLTATRQTPVTLRPLDASPHHLKPPIGQALLQQHHRHTADDAVSSRLSQSPIFGSPAANQDSHWVRMIARHDQPSDSETEHRDLEPEGDDAQRPQWQQADYDHEVARSVEIETDTARTEDTQQPLPSTSTHTPLVLPLNPKATRSNTTMPLKLPNLGSTPVIMTTMPTPIRLEEQRPIHPLSPAPSPTPYQQPSQQPPQQQPPRARSLESMPKIVVHETPKLRGFGSDEILPQMPKKAVQPLPPLPASAVAAGPRIKPPMTKVSALPPPPPAFPPNTVPYRPAPKQPPKPFFVKSQQPISLTNPPRKCIHHGKILQVINTSTVKDRYLLLFNDILLIVKPMSDGQPSIDSRFQVKDILELKKISLSLSRDKEDPKTGVLMGNRKIPQILADFIHTFDQNPTRALNTFIQKRALHPDPVSVAHLLFKTPELSKSQLAIFLSQPANRHVYRAFLDQFQFGGVLLDDALRLFLSRLCLPERDPGTKNPSERSAKGVDYLLEEFSRRWYEANANLVVFDAFIAHKLVIAMIVLNAQLYSNEGAEVVRDREEVGILVRPRVPSQPTTPTIPSTPTMAGGTASSTTGHLPSSGAMATAPQQNYFNQELDDLTAFPTPTVDSFVESFQLLDQQRIVPRDLLQRLFQSIGNQALDITTTTKQNAFLNEDTTLAPNRKRWPIMMSPAALPPRLTLRIPSDPITITVPVLNPHLSIHFAGRDLKFEPPVLEFGSHRSQKFRILGTTPGRKTMTIKPKLSSEKGAVDLFYDLQALPLKHTVAIERQFMRHTFQISLVNDIGTKRRYLFGTSSAAEKDEWARALTDCLAEAKGRDAARLNQHTGLEQSISLQILKELLLGVEASDEDEAAGATATTTVAGTEGSDPSAAASVSNGIGVAGGNTSGATGEGASGGPSIAAAAVGVRASMIVHASSPTLGSHVESLPGASALPPMPLMKDSWMCKMPKPGERVPDRLGWELVKLVEQNSLLPYVLGFMGALSRDRQRRIDAALSARQEAEAEDEDDEDEDIGDDADEYEDSDGIEYDLEDEERYDDEGSELYSDDDVEGDSRPEQSGSEQSGSDQRAEEPEDGESAGTQYE
ncbi:hypothetical protein BGZ73_003988 [Actinomortierella ambigua]|nr:hypothetical protein BGZ73_003988 [Actinomortierella ambigua]